MSSNAPLYVIITPARDEEENISHTIASMAKQTHLPTKWVIVNDGSQDRTKEIIDEAAAKYPWIVPVHRKNRGFRKQGGGVVEAFYDGFREVEKLPWEFMVKFDADLSFEPDFFERCIAKFREDSTLGIGGGLICHEKMGALVCESPGDPAFHVRGATKIYRRECWDGIGGLLQAPGWDTIDELKANMLGWKTHSFPDIPLKHHRFTGTVDGRWKNLVKFGLANYITGYHPMFMFAKCLKRSLQNPYLVGAAGLWWGFMKGYLKSVPQVNDAPLIRYVRQQQLNKLIGRPSLW
jgi:biofilm PGA synthesis N-glycosyltransferase PgaC